MASPGTQPEGKTAHQKQSNVANTLSSLPVLQIIPSHCICCLNLKNSLATSLQLYGN